MTNTITVQVKLYMLTCITCGIKFGIPDEYDTRLRETHSQFYCPSGHPQVYLAETEEDKLKKLLSEERETSAEMNRRREELQQQLLREQKKQKLIKQKAASGVCQFCHRTVKQMAAHVQTCHPAEEKEVLSQ